MMQSRTAMLVAILAGTAGAQHWYDAPRMFDAASGAFHALADLDNDGDRDAVQVSLPFQGNALVITALLDAGAGDFRTAGSFTSPAQAFRGAWVGDVTGDGIADIAGATLPENPAIGATLLVWPGTGTGAFGAAVVTPFGRRVLDAGIADVDGDGRRDLVVLSRSANPANATDFRIQWFLGTPAGVFMAGPPLAVPLLPGISARPVLGPGFAVVDLDGNGVPDVAGLQPDGAALRTVLSTGVGLAFGGSLPAFSGAQGGGVTRSDLDGNGWDDLVLWGWSASATLVRSIHLFPGGIATAGTTLSLPPIAPLPYAPLPRVSVLATHLDQDGIRDLAVAYISGEPIGEMSVTLVRGLPAGAWVAGPTIRFGEAVEPFANRGAVADVDGDGFEDVAVGRALIYGTGAFRNPMASFALPPLTNVFWFDLEGDGDLDAVGLQLAGTVPIEVNDGRGRFSSSLLAWPAPPAGTTYLVSTPYGDLDGDGRLDWIVNSHTPIPSLPTCTCTQDRLLGDDGNGTVGDRHPVSPYVVGGLYGVAVDYDGDGDLDLGAQSTVLLNDGTGFFGTSTGSFANWRVSTSGDLDGDGDRDLVAVFAGCPSSSPWSVAVLWNDPAGPALQPLSTGNAAPCVNSFVSPFVQDLDADGDLDIVVDDAFQGTSVSILRNDGARMFTAVPVLSEPTFQLSRFLATDVDADGGMDLLVVRAEGFGAASVGIYRKSGPGFSYEAPRTFLMPDRTGAGTIDLLDVDSDGDLDLCGNSGAALSTRFRAPQAGYSRQFGASSFGSGNFAPVLGARGPFRAGLPSSLRLRNARGGTAAVLVIGAAESQHQDFPVPGATSYAEPWLAFIDVPLGGSPAPGAGSWTLTAPTPASFANQSLFFQFGILDPGAPFGVAVTNGLEIHYGP